MGTDHQSSSFKTTRWSMILSAAREGEALATLVKEYWSPMYAYVRRSGYTPDEAADMVQEFIAERILSGLLLKKADPERGRFRAFLKLALKHFLTDQSRRERAAKRSPAAGNLLGSQGLEDFEPRDEDDPSTAFDRQWVATLLSRTLERTRDECEREGRIQHWQAFERVVLLPSTTRVEPLPLAEVAQAIGAASPHVVSSMAQTVQRKFRRLLRTVIEETVADTQDADHEFRELRAYLD